MAASSIIYIIRHGEALHNVEHGCPHRDPPLTLAGEQATKSITPPDNPDLILISPMIRTIQTAMNVFPSLQSPSPSSIPVQIWPDLRETHDAVCNQGVSRAELRSKFPQFDFSECPEQWDYPLNTVKDSTARAENVRKRIKGLSVSYKNIVVVTHRGLIAYLVKGRRYNLCEMRSYTFATEEEGQDESVRRGLNCDTLQAQDFGPTVLVLRKQWSH